MKDSKTCPYSLYQTHARTVFPTKITAIYIFLLSGIDGLGAIYFRNATQNMSTLHSFMQNGAYSTYARGVYPTVNIEKLPHCALYTLFITSFPKRCAKPTKSWEHIRALRTYHALREGQCSIYFLFLSDEGPMRETLDHTIRIGSTPTFLYFDLNTEYKADNLIYQNPSCHYLYKYLYNANKT